MEIKEQAQSSLLGSTSQFLAEYIQKTRQFSRNANLYVLHVIGMDMIHGSWNVLFNLYLLAIGFDVRFVGARLMVDFTARAITALPAGLVSDRIGRKASFILGDGVGAALGLLMINSRSDLVLLSATALGAFFSNLHHTSEAAFMMENSKPSERVHLFSVAGSFRTLSAMGGTLVAGLIPTLFADDVGKINAYRFAAYGGLALWFSSLVPAVMLRSEEALEHPEQMRAASAKRSLRTLFSDIAHPQRIALFVLTSALISFGSSAVVPLMNVVFHEGHTHAKEGQIGVIFAVGEMGLAATMLGVPFLAGRMRKVDAIASTRLLALPFVLGMGLLPVLIDQGALLLTLVGASYVGRVVLFRMGDPLDDAFNMEVLEPKERATNTGMEIAVGGAVSTLAVFISSRLMGLGDFTTPFVISASAYLAAVATYWWVFRKLETPAASAAGI